MSDPMSFFSGNTGIQAASDGSDEVALNEFDDVFLGGQGQENLDTFLKVMDIHYHEIYTTQWDYAIQIEVSASDWLEDHSEEDFSTLFIHRLRYQSISETGKKVQAKYELLFQATIRRKNDELIICESIEFTDQNFERMNSLSGFTNFFRQLHASGKVQDTRPFEIEECQ